MADPTDHDADVGVIWLENLHAPSRPDTVIAARYVALNLRTGERIGAYDVYLMSTGTVDIWEDLDPDQKPYGGEARRAHEDWRDVIEPLLASAIGARGVAR